MILAIAILVFLAALLWEVKLAWQIAAGGLVLSAIVRVVRRLRGSE